MKKFRFKTLLSFVLVFALVIALAPIAKAYPGVINTEETEESVEWDEEGGVHYLYTSYPARHAHVAQDPITSPWDYENWPGKYSGKDEIPEEKESAEKEEAKKPEEKEDEINPPTGDVIVYTQVVLAAAAAGFVQLSKKDR